MSSTMDRVENFAGIQRRRRYTVEQKLAVLAEASQPGMTISYVGRRHGIASSLIFGWRRRMNEGRKEAIRTDDEIVASSKVKALERRIQEPKRVLGRKTVGNEILRETVKVAHETDPHDPRPRDVRNSVGGHQSIPRSWQFMSRLCLLEPTRGQGPADAANSTKFGFSEEVGREHRISDAVA